MTMRFEKGKRIGQRGAVYEFEVKLSMRVRGVAISDRDLEVDTQMAVEELEDTLRQQFRWIGRVYLTGRSNGWLAIEDKTGGATKGALEVIGEKIDAARERFEADLVQSYGYEKGFQPNAIDPKLRKAYDFFKQQGGGVVGRAGAGALNLARAEQYADDNGWEAIWEDDPEEYETDDPAGRPAEVLTCVLRDENGVVLGSLGSIGMSGNTRQDKDYARVVEAELALEAMPGEGLVPNRLPRYDYVDELRTKSLERLRSMQSVTEQQIARAVSRGNTRALEELQTRQRELEAAIMQKEFGGDGDLQRNGWTRVSGPAEQRSGAKAFHYIARIKGPTPTRFFVRPGESLTNAATHAFAGWAHTRDMTLWPTSVTGEYTAKWYDEYASSFRESPLTIVEEKDAALRPNGAPEPRRFVTGSGPWWTYYETGSFQNGDKAIHIHRTATQKLARMNALSLQRVHGGFVTVIHRGREAGTVGPERASWIPERAP